MELTPQIVALYMGQKFKTPDGIGVLCGISQDGIVKVEFGAFGPDFEVSHTLPFVKPILRRTESLTEIEARELYEIRLGQVFEPRPEWLDDEDKDLSALEDVRELVELYDDYLTLTIGRTEIWLKLLSWGFDLFGLIDSGVAIDAATLEKTLDQ